MPSDKKWFVFVVKATHEIRISNALSNIGIENYCPTVKEVRQWSDRKKMVTRPLISGYIFVHVEEKERHGVFIAKEVIRCLFWEGKPVHVPIKEMNALKAHLNNESVGEVQLAFLKEGEPITIKSGKFIAQEGIIKESSPKRVKITLASSGLIVNIAIRNII